MHPKQPYIDCLYRVSLLCSVLAMLTSIAWFCLHHAFGFNLGFLQVFPFLLLACAGLTRHKARRMFRDSRGP